MKYKLVITLLLVSLRLSSQEIHFVNGPRLDYYDNESFQFIGQDTTRLVVTYDKFGEHFLATFDKSTMSQISEVKIPYPEERYYYQKEDLILLKDVVIAFYSYHDNADTVTTLEMLRFNYDGTQTERPLVLEKYHGKQSGISFKIFRRPADKEFIIQKVLAEKEQYIWVYDHFDYNGDKLNSQTHSFNSDDGHFLYSVIDDDFNSYTLSKDRARNRANYSITIFRPKSSTSDTISLRQLSTGNYYLNYFFYTATDEKGNIVLICPYSEDQEAPALGLYLVKIEAKSGKLLAEKVIRFVKQREGEDNFSLNSCIPVSIEWLANNGMRIIFESRSEIKTQLYSMITVAKEYDIDNIVTADLDSNFVPVEMHKIKKQQHTNSDYFEYTGFVTLKRNDQNFYVYNELPENLEKSPEKMKKVDSNKFDETVVIYTTVESNLVKRKLLMSKSAGSLVDAIIPRKHIDAKDKNETYVVHRINEDYFLMRVFVD